MIQIDMTMPKTCVECPLYRYISNHWKECAVNRKITGCSTKRPKHCPLIEIPTDVDATLRP